SGRAGRLARSTSEGLPSLAAPRGSIGSLPPGRGGSLIGRGRSRGVGGGRTPELGLGWLDRLVGCHVKRFQRAPCSLHEAFHAQLRIGQQPRAAFVQCDATLVKRYRGLELLSAGLQLGNDALELGKG